MRIDPRSGVFSLRHAAGEIVGRMRICHRVSRAYHLCFAREDARLRGIITPLGVWACEHCPHVSLTMRTHHEHLVFVHA